MISDTRSPDRQPNRQPGHVVADHAPPSSGVAGSYVDWAAILAGGVFALALGFLLISFGAGLGLSLTSPYRGDGVSASWLAIAAGIWFAWVMVTSFGAGGYLTGRMRRHAGDASPPEVEVRDGTHGLLVWATGMVFSTILAATGVGGVIGLGATAAGSASDLASEVVDSEYFANVMLRGTTAADEGADAAATTAGQETAEGETGGTPTPAAQSGQSSQQTEASGAIDPAVQQQIASIIVRSAASGEMAERDRDYLSRVVASNTGLDPDQARTRVDEVTAEIDAARDDALAVAETARVAGVVFGFIVAATLLIGAVAAFFAAAAGGRHRDDGLGFDIFTARR